MLEEIRMEEAAEQAMEAEREVAMVDMVAGMDLSLEQMLEVMVAVALEEVRKRSQYVVWQETQ